MSAHARLSEGSTWPLPDLPQGDELGLAWRLTYGTPTRSDLLRAASIISAYGYLVMEVTAQRRALIIRELRAALDLR